MTLRYLVCVVGQDIEMTLTSGEGQLLSWGQKPGRKREGQEEQPFHFPWERPLIHSKGASWELGGGDDEQSGAGDSRGPGRVRESARGPGWRTWRSQGAGAEEDTSLKLT